MVKNDFGVWEIVIPAIKRVPAIPHNSKVKVGYLRFPFISLRRFGVLLTSTRFPWRSLVVKCFIDFQLGSNVLRKTFP